MRRPNAMLAGIVLGVVALAGSSSAALASNGAATPFKASYEWPAGTYYECSGARVDNRVFVKDSETCRVTGDTSMLTPGTYSGHPYGSVPWIDHPIRMSSDFDGLIALDWYARVVDNGDGTVTQYLVAYFLYH